MSVEVIASSIFFFVVLMGGFFCVSKGVDKLYALPKPEQDPKDPLAWGRGASEVMLFWIWSGLFALLAGGYVGYLLGFIAGGADQAPS